MSTHTAVPPVRRTITVSQPLDKAFALFTTKIDKWWPEAGAVAEGATPTSGPLVLEPRQAGQVYRRRDDGSVEVFGEVRVWEPPHRLVLGWQHAGLSRAVTEVDVRFTTVETGTKVDLEHRGWEGLGGQAAEARSGYEAAWVDSMRSYEAASRENGAAVASLILGIASIFLPIVGFFTGIFAVVYGIAGRRRARKGAGSSGMATAGLTLGAIGVLLWSVLALGAASVMIVRVDGGSESQVPAESYAPAPETAPETAP